MVDRVSQAEVSREIQTAASLLGYDLVKTEPGRIFQLMFNANDFESVMLVTAGFEPRTYDAYSISVSVINKDDVAAYGLDPIKMYSLLLERLGPNIVRKDDSVCAERPN